MVPCFIQEFDSIFSAKKQYTPNCRRSYPAPATTIGKTPISKFCRVDRQTGNYPSPLPLAPIEYLELVADIGGEEAGNVAETLG